MKLPLSVGLSSLRSAYGGAIDTKHLGQFGLILWRIRPDVLNALGFKFLKHLLTDYTIFSDIRHVFFGCSCSQMPRVDTLRVMADHRSMEDMNSSTRHVDFRVGDTESSSMSKTVLPLKVQVTISERVSSKWPFDAAIAERLRHSLSKPFFRLIMERSTCQRVPVFLESVSVPGTVAIPVVSSLVTSLDFADGVDH